MSGNDASAEKRPGLLARMWAAPQQFSTAAWAAIAVAIFLVLTVAVVWTVFWLDPIHVPWRHSLSVGRVLTVFVLLILIPPLVYWCLRVWLEGESSRYPDLDYAWKAGVTALRRNGIDLDAAPIFLVLGSSGEDLERAMMQASNLSMRVRGEPEGPAPLHWYANPDAIYLYCSEAGWVSALTALAEKRGRQADRRGAPLAEAPWLAPATPTYTPAPSMPARPTVRMQPPSNPVPAPPTVAPPSPAAPPAPSPPPDAPIGGTIMLDQFLTAGNAPVAERRAAGPATHGGSSPRLSGTATFDEPVSTPPPLVPSSALVAASPSPTVPSPAPAMRQESVMRDDQPLALDAQDAVESLQRLEYLGQLLRRARHPLCPINGVLVLLPFPMIERGVNEAAELQKAVKSDLAALERSLELRCPVTALVIGMESESGFRELVRRVGRHRAAGQRFGRRFDLRAFPTAEQMAALCVHVCGVFEDWIYTLFREEGALARPGNPRLYALLCKVRCNLKGPLMEVLAGGFGHDPQTAMTEQPIAFSGCYFAATGASADQQAFVRGVFEKLVEEQEDVAWTRRALVVSRRVRIFIWTASALAVLFIVLLLALLAQQLFS